MEDNNKLNKLLNQISVFFSEKQTEIKQLKEELINCRKSNAELVKENDLLREEINNSNTQLQSQIRVTNLQIQLLNFWNCSKSNVLIGRLYEQYVGYLYEKRGWEVEYTGMSNGYSDLGRDLVCKKGNDILIIQCKNWSRRSVIHESHIFQLIGTVMAYKKDNPNISNVIKGVICTTTNLSQKARGIAAKLDIQVRENLSFNQNFPCIKCKKEENGGAYYYLPFNRQYFNIKLILKNNDCYCNTAQEAESKNFKYIGE